MGICRNPWSACQRLKKGSRYSYCLTNRPHVTKTLPQTFLLPRPILAGTAKSEFKFKIFGVFTMPNIAPTTELPLPVPSPFNLLDKSKMPILNTPLTLLTDAPPDITVEHQQNLDQASKESVVLRDLACGLYLADILGPVLGKSVKILGFQAYRDQLMRECGNPTDPIERMLIEQLAMAHHSIARLHTKAASAKTAEDADRYSSAASRLLGEFRRSAQCYKDFRSPAAGKQITLVAQQNLAAGNQQIAYVGGDTDAASR